MLRVLNLGCGYIVRASHANQLSPPASASSTNTDIPPEGSWCPLYFLHDRRHNRIARYHPVRPRSSPADLTPAETQRYPHVQRLGFDLFPVHGQGKRWPK